MLRGTKVSANVADPIFMRNIRKTFSKYRDMIGRDTKSRAISSDAFMDVDDKGPSWYLGHMNVAMHDLREKMKGADFVLEMRDARLPFSTENPNIRKVCRGKPRLIVFNKAELANEEVNLAIQRYYENQGDFAMFTSTRRSWRDVVEAIQKFAVHVLPSQKYKTAAHVGMVVGMPNVGKSTLINALRMSHEYQFRREDFRKSRSPEETSNMAGSTRHTKLINVSRDPNIVLYDTPGLTLPGHFSREAGLKLAACGVVTPNQLTLSPQLVARYIYDVMVCSGAVEHLAECLHLPRTPVSFDDCISLLAERSGRSGTTMSGMNHMEICYSFLITDFMSGHLGRVTLDRLPRKVQQEMSAAGMSEVAGQLPSSSSEEAAKEDTFRDGSTEGSLKDDEFVWTHHVNTTDVVSRYPEFMREVMEEVEGRRKEPTIRADDAGVISRKRGPISRVSALSESARENIRLKPGR